jgi:hypothetical protein
MKYETIIDCLPGYLPASLPPQAKGEAAVDVRVAPGTVAPHHHAETIYAVGLLKAFRRRWRLASGVGVLVGGGCGDRRLVA